MSLETVKVENDLFEKILAEARESAAKINGGIDDQEKVRTWIEIANISGADSDVDLAEKKVLEAVADKEGLARDSLYKQLARLLAECGKFERAQKFAKDIKDNDERNQAWGFICKAEAQMSNLDNAFSTLGNIHDDIHKDKVLVKMVGVLICNGNTKLAWEIIPKIKTTYQKCAALMVFIRDHAEQGNFTDARQTADELLENEFKADAYRLIADNTGEDDDFDKAFEVAMQIPGYALRTEKLLELARVLTCDHSDPI